MPADLTFSQLASALPSGSVLEDQNYGVVLIPSAISGDTIDELSDSGVVETLFKLIRAAGSAQTAANQNAPAGQRLNAFPPLVPSTPTIAADGQIRTRMTASIVAEMPVDPNAAVGPQQ